MSKESIIFVGLFTVILSVVILLLSYTSSDQELNQYVKIKVQQGIRCGRLPTRWLTQKR